MTDVFATRSKPKEDRKNVSDKPLVLELSGGRIHSTGLDGSSRKVIVADFRLPDGIVVDVEAGHIYWINNGAPHRKDGSIERIDFDGNNREIIVPPGVTCTPKLLHLEKRRGKLYWSDREGTRIMRANLDGTKVEMLVKENPRTDKVGKSGNVVEELPA